MSVSLGKRKNREVDSGEDSQGHHGSTLFVSNLPYTATSTDLQTLFSDIAPVRSAFVVLDHDSRVSKGVGYVSFAIREDAQLAHDQIEKEGLALVGRKLRVQWADQKPKEGHVKMERTSKPPKSAQVHSKAPYDPLAVRTIVISGLPTSIDSKAIWKKVKKLEGAEKIEYPIEGESSDVAHALFTASSAAHDAVAKLHAHVFKGSLLSVTLKKRLEGLAKPVATPKKATKPEMAPSHASRLIVRNLPFNATEQDLKALFLPYGPIYSIHMPVDAKVEEEKESKGEEDNSTCASYQGRKARAASNKGFAFVWMFSKKDAEKAMEACNGATIKAGLADDMVKGKQKKKKELRLEKKAKAIETKEEDVEMGQEKRPDAVAEGERVIAVDWALSKNRWNEEKAKLDQQDADMEDSESEEGDGEEESQGDENDSQDGLGVHDASDDERSDDEAPIKPELPPPAAGTTLFIRNVPFEATDEDLRVLFRAFGPLRYARVTFDAETGRSRGTGFACFWNIEDADKAVAQSELLRAEAGGATGQTTEPKKNPFKLPSILTPDPSGSLARNLVLQGRTLDVVRAVTRDEAGKLKEDGERRREKADKRNLYLLREGVILPNTPAASIIPESALERRAASFNARRALLRSNPSLYVSKTRLSVRQIPLFVTERMLKRLSSHAVSAFEEEVKSQSRQPLSTDELADKDSQDEDDSSPKVPSKSKGSSGGVRQSKIVRLAEKVDGLTGKGRSKGYGFIEMRTHADALRVLRWANNNSDLGSLWQKWWKEELELLIKQGKEKKQQDDEGETRLKKLKDELEKINGPEGEKMGKGKGTLIVEFSIENVQVVQRRTAQQENTSSKHSERPNRKLKSDTVPEHEPESKDIPTPKKRRVSKGEGGVEDVKTEQVTDAEKLGNKLGSLIGRKRKQRQSKGKR